MIRIVLPIIIIVLGGAAMGALISSAGTEKRSEIPPVELHVNVYSAQSSAESAKVYSTGVVQAAQEVNIIPQVSGAIVYVAEGLQSGRRFKEGELIAQIDREDYQLALQQEVARVEQAELNLKLEQERLSASEREWVLLGKEGEAPELASRRPQLALAEINVKSAQASKKRAELALSRTSIKAPFNSIVKMEQLDIGQIVGPTGVVAALLGTDHYLIRVSIPTSRLSDIDIPDITSEIGSQVQVIYSPSDRLKIEKTGEVLRLESELDPQSKTANLLIGIKNPLEGDGLPLMVGAYVQASIAGKVIKNAFLIPSVALRDGNHVLIADQDNKLARKDVVVGWVDGEKTIILSGLAEGSQIVTTPISFPIYGSPLTIEKGE
jgi:membrane fusion protein, multidrug efflux system